MRWSFSRFSVAEQCAWKFHRQYVLKERGGPSDAMRLGSTVHLCLQWVIESVVSAKHKGLLDGDKVAQVYAKAYAHTFDGGGSLGLFEQGLTMVKAWLAQLGPVDWETFVGIEENFHLVLPSGLELRGVIDLIEDDGEVVTVTDYKTNRALYQRHEVEESLQLGIYALAARQMYPGRRVRLAYHMLRHGIVMYTERTVGQLEAVERYAETLAARADGWASTSRGFAYKPTPNVLCGWCDFKDKCPAYAEALEVGDQEVAAVDSLDDLVVERRRAALAEKLAKKRKTDVDAILKAAVKQEGPLSAGGATVELVKVASRTYEPRRVAEVLAESLGLDVMEAMEKVTTVDRTKLKKVLAAAREVDECKALLVEGKVDGLATVRHTARLKVKED